ncbi:MAG: hypothetical protein WCG87_00610 [Bacteroidota bacterium]
MKKSFITLSILAVISIFFSSCVTYDRGYHRRHKFYMQHDHNHYHSGKNYKYRGY